MRASPTDAVGVLAWGLRRYVLLFLACLLAGGVLAPLAFLQRDVPAQAEALVIAQRLDMDLTALPRYGEAVFANGGVGAAVAARLGDPGLAEEVIPGKVSLVAEQDSVVFRVLGHDPDPQTAADLANVAADAFIQALNAGGAGVGLFILQSPAEPAGAMAGGPRVLLVAIGVLAGLVLGLAAVSVVLVVRRPVIDAADAEEATGVPVLGTVTLPRVRRGQWAPPEDFSGLVPVCRRLLGLSTPTVLVVSRPRDTRRREQLSLAMATALMRIPGVRFVGPDHLEEVLDRRRAAANAFPPGGDAAAPPRLLLVDGSEPVDLVQPPEATATVLVVPEGIRSAALRTAIVEHLGASAHDWVLLVRRGRRSRGETVPEPGHVRIPEDARPPVPASNGS